MTGISPTTLLNYESGKTFPRRRMFLKLSVALGVTCQELIPLEEKRKNMTRVLIIQNMRKNWVLLKNTAIYHSIKA